MWRQYTLTSAGRVTTGWIQTDAPLRKGQQLTTRTHGETLIWTVVKVGQVALDDPPARDWKVGGIASS